jgi:uncharacterized protein (TIGR02246 family)
MRRAYWTTAALLTCGLILFGQNRFDEARERALIQAVLDAYGAAWTKGDAKVAAAVMTEDSDWVSSDGSVVTGRRAIEAAHEEVLTGSGKGSRHSHPGTPKIRFIRRDVAIVDGDSFVGGLRDKDGKELPAQLSCYIAVFVKEDGRWLVTAFRSLPQVKSSTSAH